MVHLVSGAGRPGGREGRAARGGAACTAWAAGDGASDVRHTLAMARTARVATVEDADAVTALVQSAYRGEESRAGWTTEADLLAGQRTDPEMVRELVLAPASVILIADDADAGLLACCHLEQHDDVAHLGMFAVRPGLQGRGTGRAMLRAAESYARHTWGVGAMALSVINHRHELIAWYERCGFARTGIVHEFPYGDERYGEPLRDDIVLLEMAKTLA